MRARRIFTLLVILCLSVPAMAGRQRGPAQAGDDQTRDFGFFSRFRPKGRVKPHKKVTYRRTGPALGAVADDAAIGVTFWRARAATRRDPAGTRDIVQKEDGTQTVRVLARVGGNPELSIGQEFRIGVETVRTGYLYVVNRPLRTDGSAAAAYLIFPTLRIRGGDNRVQAGRMIMLPTPPDEQPFEIDDSRGDLLGEELIVIVTSKPLDVETKRGRYELPRELVDGWIAQWGAPTEAYELEGGADAPYSAAEKAAATTQGRVLTAADPGPQLVQRIAAKPGDPLLVRLTVQMRRGGTR
jgi:hypothetical protein